MRASPLNGRRTHPLSDHARTVLRSVVTAPVPLHTINPGVRDRLTRAPRPLAEVVRIGDRAHLKATKDGADFVTVGHCHVWLPLAYSPDGMRLLTEVCDVCQLGRQAPEGR